MILLIEYFTPNDKNRDIEYITAISENLKVNEIEKIIVFISDDSKLELASNKINIVKLENRPTFKTLFQYCNDNYPNKLCCIANTDIIFDNTISIIDNIDNTFLALTRWDIVRDNNKFIANFYNAPWRGVLTTGQLSQDSWIFKTPIQIDERSNFLMGKPGCDNRIIQIYHELGYNIKNPSLQIITKHLHLSNYRTYNNRDIIPGPYLLVTPSNDINIDCDKKTIPHF